MKKRDARLLSPEAQEYIRLQAVRAIVDGMKQVEAVHVFGVSRAAVGKWMAAYRRGGLKALRARPRGRPKDQGRLKGWQAAASSSTGYSEPPHASEDSRLFHLQE
jgi:hypothetical protein